MVFSRININQKTANKPVLASAVTVNSQNKIIDKAVASNIASTVAQEVHLAVAPSIISHADNLTTQDSIKEDGSGLALQKTQVIATKDQVNKPVTHYKVEKNDNLANISAKFKVSEISIRWSNDIDPGSEPLIGSTLAIPSVEGIVYQVKAGDSIDKIASKYSSDKTMIVSFNDIELSGIKAGQLLVIPDGSLPDAERPGYQTPSNNTNYTPISSGSTGDVNGGDSWFIRTGTPMYSGNKYFFGNCTAYAFDRRVELGLRVSGNWGNAAEWSYNAMADGYKVDHTPAVGAIIQTGAGWFGHVGVVEKLLPNGDIQISEMNYYGGNGGFNVVNGRTIPASAVGNFSYIH